MTLALLLLLCVAVTFLLGLPLLLKPDSLVLDLIAVGILTLIVLGFVRETGDWWMILPILALLGLTVRLDRRGREGETGMSATRTLLRLWGTAFYVQLALILYLPISLATGFGTGALRYIAHFMLIAFVAGVLFRFGFVRSCRRDRRALAREAGALEVRRL